MARACVIGAGPGPGPIGPGPRKPDSPPARTRLGGCLPTAPLGAASDRLLKKTGSRSNRFRVRLNLAGVRRPPQPDLSRSHSLRELPTQPAGGAHTAHTARRWCSHSPRAAHTARGWCSHSPRGAHTAFRRAVPSRAGCVEPGRLCGRAAASSRRRTPTTSAGQPRRSTAPAHADHLRRPTTPVNRAGARRPPPPANHAAGRPRRPRHQLRPATTPAGHRRVG
jgi:hypothetical protein